jgi:hypothetical protein
MTRIPLPALAFGALTLVVGLVYGYRTDRWQSSVELDDAVRRLDSVPASFGDWKGEPQHFDEEALRHAGIKGHKGFRYRNVVTGRDISMLLVCGRSGPISVHTPDVCYGGAGYVPISGEQKLSVNANDREYTIRLLQLKPPATAGKVPIEVCWSWNGGDGWISPDNQRIALSRYAVVYKLYVVHEVRKSGAEPTTDASVAFLKTFLPELNRLFAR